MCCKIKSSAVKCIHYSWSVICLQRAYSKRQYSNHFSYSSVKDISTTAQNASLSDTVSFLERESQPTGSLISLEGVRFLFSCSQTIKSQWAPCHGLLSPGSSQASKTHLATWAQPVSHRAVDLVGLCPSLCSVRDSHPLLGAVPHALTPCSFPHLSL